MSEFDEPNENDERSHEQAGDPIQRAKEKAEELRMHAELYAIFEGNRKFDARILAGMDPDIARDMQRRIGKLDKAKTPESPILPESSWGDARSILELAKEKELPTNDYHVMHRPGEVMMMRWLQADEVDLFYERFQKHFDVAMEQYREEEQNTHGWKKDSRTEAYLKALEELKFKMDERYLRDTIRKHKVFVLSTLMVDEMDILHLCDYVMGVPAAEVVGERSAPPSEATDMDRAWFFKLFSLRGTVDGVERMCFFTYMQKAEEGW